MVTISLFDTLLGLNSEEIMLEIILKYLIPCQHVPILHRHKINKIDPFFTAVDFILDLSPEVMKEATNSIAQQQIQPVSKTIGANWNHYGNNTGDSLYSNYHAYLFDARHKIAQCKIACEQWTSLYKYQKSPSKKSQNSEKNAELIRNFLTEFDDEAISITNGSFLTENDKSSKQLDSLQSLGESSGYESFKYRPEEDSFESSEKNFPIIGEPWKDSSIKPEPIIDLDFSEDLFKQGTISLGKNFINYWSG